MPIKIDYEVIVIAKHPFFTTIMSPQDSQSAALVAHIISQVESNVEFLASQNIISQADASTILSKLPNTANNNANVDNLASRVNSLGVRAPASRPVPSAPAANQARALWAYNENGQVSMSSYDLFLFPVL